MAKFASVPNFTDPRLNFVKTYTYDLGEDDLVSFGAAQYASFLNCVVIGISNVLNTDLLILPWKSTSAIRT